MDFFEVVQARHSTRAFTANPIGRAQLQQILQTANAAPSAGNLQAYEIYAVTNCDRLTSLAQAAGDQTFIAQAPIALVFCANPERSARKYHQRGRSLYCLQDAAIACAYAQLAATALGLGSVWVGAFEVDAVRDILGADQDWLPVAILPIGYPAEKPAGTPRRSIDDLVHPIHL